MCGKVIQNSLVEMYSKMCWKVTWETQVKNKEVKGD